MKKYIIGLFSAICLMGAGCTEFEDFTPVGSFSLDFESAILPHSPLSKLYH